MEDRIISFETAKIAKEKGFDLKVVYGYKTESPINKEGDMVSCYHFDEWGDIEPIDWNNKKYKHNPEGIFSAPTQSGLQKWLRDKYNLWINIYVNNCDPSCFKEGHEKTIIISFRIYKLIDNKLFSGLMVDGFGDTYEGTLESGLIKCLKNLEKWEKFKD